MHTQPFAGGGVDVKAEVYVDRFLRVTSTPELLDFKEEITVNLIERIKELQNKGLDPEVAFEKAVAELGIHENCRSDKPKQEERSDKQDVLSLKTGTGQRMLSGIASAGVLFGIVASPSFSLAGRRLCRAAALLPFLVPSGGDLSFSG